MPTASDNQSLEAQLYLARLRAEALRREVFQQSDPASAQALFEELAQAENNLSALEAQFAAARQADPASGRLVSLDTTGGPSLLLSAQTTGLVVDVHLRMAQVPTAIYHLLDKEQNPLVSCSVKNLSGDGQIRRIKITSFIEDYSARAVDTFDLASGETRTFDQLPTLFPHKVRDLTELTRATLNVEVVELEGGTQKVESHTTHPIWLLARTTAPLAVRDPMTGLWNDLSQYLGAFVTPNASPLMTFLREAANFTPQKRLVGYQGDKTQVEPQVRAVFEALKRTADITYVNSVIAFSPDQGASNQRVRLPRESLADHQANCIDGTVLFASLLEGISLNPGLVLIPGHAFLAWQTWSEGDAPWHYLETTMIGSNTYDEACKIAESYAASYRKLAEQNNDPNQFRLWSLRELRTRYGITPME